MCFIKNNYFFKVVNMKSDDECLSDGDAVWLADAIEIRIPGCQNWGLPELGAARTGGCHLVVSRESQW